MEQEQLTRIGISSTKTKNFNFSGKPFSSSDDFIVEEILPGGEKLSIEPNGNDQVKEEQKDFLVFTLVKKGMSTQDALKRISNRLHINIRRFAYCGNKDKNAITAQRISVFKLPAGALKIDDKNLFVKDVHYADSGCKIGELYGNRFMIRIMDFIGSDKDMGAFAEEITDGFPNFFGPQRFGSSSLNIDVSKKALRCDFKGAVKAMLCSERRESRLSSSSREKIREVFSALETEDADKTKLYETIGSLPGFLFNEIGMLRHLVGNKNDFIGAFRTIPKYSRLLILQAYQSYFFNLVLSEALVNRLGINTIPTIGYDLELANLKAGLAGIFKKIMNSEDITLEQFKIKSMPELSLKTFEREAFVKPENFSYERSGKDLILRFTLRKGQYATSILIEMFKSYLF